MDLGSAKAIVELQKKHNELLDVVQKGSANEAKQGHALLEEFPDNYQLQETAKEAERLAERSAALAKAKRNPYASLGPFYELLKRIQWIFSDEGLKWIFGLLLTVCGGGSAASILHFRQKVKIAHKQDPNKPLE